MLNTPRFIASSLCATLLATGVSLAQNAPPPQPMPTAGTAQKSQSKCKTKPNGCPKRKNQKKKKQQQAMPGGTMPQPAPTH